MTMSFGPNPRPADLRLPAAPSSETERREVVVPERFETRSEWEQWRQASFPTQAAFEAWREEHRRGDLDALRRHVPDEAMRSLERRGMELCATAIQEDGALLTNIRDERLLDFVRSNRTLAHHAINPSYAGRSLSECAWGAASFRSAENTLRFLEPVANRHGMSFEGLSLEEARELMPQLRDAVDSGCVRDRRNRPDRQSRIALNAISRFEHQYQQGLKVQAMKAEQLWQLAEQGTERFPDYIETAGHNNRDGLAIAMKGIGRDSDHNGRSDAYDEHIARTRVRTGAGLYDPEPERTQLASATAPDPAYVRRHTVDVYRGRIVDKTPTLEEALGRTSVATSSTTERYRPPTSTYIGGMQEYRHWISELEQGRPISVSGPQMVDVLFKHYAIRGHGDDRVPHSGVTREEGAVHGLRLLAEQYQESGNRAALEALRRSPGILALGVRENDPMFRMEADPLPGPGSVRQEQVAAVERRQQAVARWADDHLSRGDFAGFHRYLASEQAAGAFSPEEQRQFEDGRLTSQGAAFVLYSGSQQPGRGEPWLRSQLDQLSIEQLDGVMRHAGTFQIERPAEQPQLDKFFAAVAAYREARSGVREETASIIRDIDAPRAPEALRAAHTPEQLQLITAEATSLLRHPGHEALGQVNTALPQLRQRTLGYLQWAREQGAPSAAPAGPEPIPAPRPGQQPEPTPADDPFAGALAKAEQWFQSYLTNMPGTSLDDALARVVQFRSRGRTSSEELTAMASALLDSASRTTEPREALRQQRFAMMLDRAARETIA